mgnify:CR=1 FL=1
MSYTPEQWQSIETRARKLGASEGQIRKWRKREGVSAEWRLKLAVADKSLLKVFASKAPDMARAS